VSASRAVSCHHGAWLGSIRTLWWLAGGTLHWDTREAWGRPSQEAPGFWCVMPVITVAFLMTYGRPRSPSLTSCGKTRASQRRPFPAPVFFIVCVGVFAPVVWCLCHTAVLEGAWIGSHFLLGSGKPLPVSALFPALSLPPGPGLLQGSKSQNSRLEEPWRGQADQSCSCFLCLDIKGQLGVPG
jgi:hypothetical protein